MRKELDYYKLRERTFDRETINYIGLIHEYKGRQELYLEQKPEELDRLIELSKIQSTESSNEIEGIVTTNQRFVQLMKDKTTPKNRSEKEIKGYRHVLDIIHRNFDYIPITPSTILQFHRELYQFSEERFGGKFKDSPNEIDAITKGYCYHFNGQSPSNQKCESLPNRGQPRTAQPPRPWGVPRDSLDQQSQIARPSRRPKFQFIAWGNLPRNHFHRL